MKMVLFTKNMVLFTKNGATLLGETDVVEEAERILREYVQRGCAVVTETGASVLPLTPPLPETVYVLWPMVGGGMVMATVGMR